MNNTLYVISVVDEELSPCNFCAYQGAQECITYDCISTKTIMVDKERDEQYKIASVVAKLGS